MKNSTDAMKESRVHDIINVVRDLDAFHFTLISIMQLSHICFSLSCMVYSCMTFEVECKS